MEQFLLVTFCDSPAGIGASLRTHVRTDVRTDGWMHIRDIGNSILDVVKKRKISNLPSLKNFLFNIALKVLEIK